jgi:hypothetical protein
VVVRTTGLRGGQAGLGSLADLVEPVAGAVLPRLPPPQADAVRAALGLSAAGVPVTGTLLGRAVAGVLRELAAAGVVVAVDDGQWVDPGSRRLLESAVVRLVDVPVRWLVAVRSGPAGRGLARVLDHELAEAAVRVDLGGLAEAALSGLVLARFPGRWSPGVLGRVVTLAAGSPYAALELARETAAQGGRDGTVVHLPATLAESLRGRLGRLDPGVLAVVQAAAVAETPARALLRAICGPQAGARVEAALDAGVLDAAPPDPVLRFSHPLLREAAGAMLTGPGRPPATRPRAGHPPAPPRSPTPQPTSPPTRQAEEELLPRESGSGGTKPLAGRGSAGGRDRAPSTISAIAIRKSTMPPMSRPIPIPNECGMVRASPPAKATGAAASVFITTTR